MAMSVKRRRWLVFIVVLLCLGGVAGYVGYRWSQDGLPRWLARHVGPRPQGTPPAFQMRREPPRPPSREERHIHDAGQLAREYEFLNRRPPQSLKELQDWAAENGKAEPEAFRSTRDGQPYDFALAEEGPVVSEHTGQGGKKWVYALKRGKSSRPVEEASGTAAQGAPPAGAAGKPGS